MSATVGPSRGQALQVATRVLARAQSTRGRFALAAGVGAALTLSAIAINVGSVGRAAVATLLTEAAFLVAVPVVSLVYSGASLGDLREDGTLVYLWLRPVRRLDLAVAATCASAGLAVPLNVAIVGLITVAGGRPELFLPAAVAAVLGTLAYVGVFVALGLRTTRSLLWGLGYVLLLEGFLARFSDQLAAVSIRRFATSVLTQLGDVRNELREVSLSTAVIALLVATVLGVALCTWWLHRLDVE
ncbi:MAG: hypothetical protein KY437_03675 [Actinobacteria bacterium]|nr:hypothetical protein [Actinomycetota bacterium]